MNWIQRTGIVCVAAVACAWPSALPADEDPSEPGAESGRFSSVTEAVSASPETAVEIVGSLCRSFPESAPTIVTSAIEGLPEATDEAVGAIVEAAVEAAPEQEAAIEAAVAELLAAGELASGGGEESGEMIVEPEAPEDEASEEAAAEADGEVDSGDEPVAAVEPETEPDTASDEAAEAVEDDAVAEPETTPAAEEGERAVAEETFPAERPERLEREVELVESLIGTLPDRAPSIARRSVGRMADEEPSWTGVIVAAAVEAAPEYEDEIVSEAIAEAPGHEAIIREAVAGQSPEEPSAPEGNADTALPERLQSEIDMAESLIRAFPERTPATVRRSVGRVAGEEAFWTGAMVAAAIAAAPEHKDEIVDEAVAAAPHHEAAIRDAAGGEIAEDEPDGMEVIAGEAQKEESETESAAAEGEESEPAEVADDGAEDEDAIFADPFVLAGATETLTLEGDRLSVRFELPVTEASRVRLAVESLELRIQPEQYFDSYKGRYRWRDMAVITGDGIVGLVFKLNPDDAGQLRETADVLERFQETVVSVEDFINSKRADEDTGLLLGDVREEIGTVYQYPSRDEIPAVFVGDFDDRTYQLAIGGSILLTPNTAPAVRHMVENLPRYEREYRDLLRKRDVQLEEFQNLTRTQPSETPVEEKDES